MHQTKSKHKTDLEAFENAFQIGTVKSTSTGLEYRVPNLDVALQSARSLINTAALNLEAVCEGSMSAIRTFIVREVRA